jgi:tetratricopeptide (TPR) repeat protein
MGEHPKSPEELISAAVHAREERKYAESLQLLQEALAAGASADIVHFQTGNVYFDAGQLDEAERAYSLALEANENFAKAMHNLGVVYRRQGKVAESVRCLKAAVRMQTAGNPGAASAPLSQRTQIIRLLAYVFALLLMAWLFMRGR